MFKLVLEKAEEPEIKSPTSGGSSKTQKEFQKNTYFSFIDYAKGFGIVKKPEVKNKAVATGLEKVIHSNPKQKQCQWMLKLLHNCSHLTR